MSSFTIVRFPCLKNWPERRRFRSSSGALRKRLIARRAEASSCSLSSPSLSKSN